MKGLTGSYKTIADSPKTWQENIVPNNTYKIAFVDPPWPGYGHRTQRWPHKNLHGDINPPPLFQMIAAAAARQDGIEVELWDSPAERLSEMMILSILAKYSPALVVVNTSTPSFDHDLHFIHELRKAGYTRKILVVGPHVTVFYRELLELDPAIDWVGLAEYDFLPRDLCRNNLNPKDLAGVAFRAEDESIVSRTAEPITDLNFLPWPDYSLINPFNYNEFLFPFRKRPVATLMTSRGCPYRCSFCLYPQVMFGQKLRVRSITNVIAEIQHLIEQFGIRFFYFEDDTFTADWKRVQHFCSALQEHNLKITWACLGRVEGVTEARLQLMKRAGCYLIKYGVETAEEQQLKSMGKNLSGAEIEAAFRITREAGMYTHATIMFGWPGDTKQTIEHTHRLLRTIRPDYVQFSICTPFPGTEFFALCEKQDWLRYDRWEDFDGAWGGVIETNSLTRHDVRSAVKSGYKRYYLTWVYLFRRLNRSLFGPDIISQWFHNIDLLLRFLRRYGPFKHDYSVISAHPY